MTDKGRLLTDGTNHARWLSSLQVGNMHDGHSLNRRDSAHNFSVKFCPSLSVALVASLTEEMPKRSSAYHTHGTLDFLVTFITHV